MIISADGNVYLGKTTFLKTLREVMASSCAIIEEYDTSLEALENKTHGEKQEYYFDLEAGRALAAKSVKAETVLLDRSFLSILAHSYAMSLLEGTDHFAGTLSLCARRIAEGKVLLPDKYLFFLQRDADKRYEDADNKGGEDVLYDAEYRRKIDMFFSRVKRELAERAPQGAQTVMSILSDMAAELPAHIEESELDAALADGLVFREAEENRIFFQAGVLIAELQRRYINDEAVRSAVRAYFRHYWCAKNGKLLIPGELCRVREENGGGATLIFDRRGKYSAASRANSRGDVCVYAEGDVCYVRLWGAARPYRLAGVCWLNQKKQPLAAKNVSAQAFYYRMMGAGAMVLRARWAILQGESYVASLPDGDSEAITAARLRLLRAIRLQTEPKELTGDWEDEYI